MRADLWSDQREAQEATRRLASLQEQVQEWNALDRRTRDLRELVDLAEQEGDEALLAEIESDAEHLVEDFDRSEFRLLFQGEYDANDVLLAIYAGAGGTDSQEWV